MRVLINDKKIEDDIDILATKEEIERAIEYLKDIINGDVPNEAIFVKHHIENTQLVTVEMIE